MLGSFISMSSEKRWLAPLRGCETGKYELSLLTSTPMNVPTARPAIAEGIPVMAIKKMAKPTDCTTGAQIMKAANMAHPKVQTLRREGFRVPFAMLTTDFKLSGGRGV